jgi:hypothetical protein
MRYIDLFPEYERAIKSSPPVQLFRGDERTNQAGRELSGYAIASGLATNLATWYKR